jgi:hypothetical protein
MSSCAGCTKKQYVETLLRYPEDSVARERLDKGLRDASQVGAIPASSVVPYAAYV